MTPSHRANTLEKEPLTRGVFNILNKTLEKCQHLMKTLQISPQHCENGFSRVKKIYTLTLENSGQNNKVFSTLNNPKPLFQLPIFQKIS